LSNDDQVGKSSLVELAGAFHALRLACEAFGAFSIPDGLYGQMGV
jgi:hypothetical protein